MSLLTKQHILFLFVATFMISACVDKSGGVSNKKGLVEDSYVSININNLPTKVEPCLQESHINAEHANGNYDINNQGHFVVNLPTAINSAKGVKCSSQPYIYKAGNLQNINLQDQCKNISSSQGQISLVLSDDDSLLINNTCKDNQGAEHIYLAYQHGGLTKIFNDNPELDRDLNSSGWDFIIARNLQDSALIVYPDSNHAVDTDILFNIYDNSGKQKDQFSWKRDNQVIIDDHMTTDGSFIVTAQEQDTAYQDILCSSKDKQCQLTGANFENNVISDNHRYVASVKDGGTHLEIVDLLNSVSYVSHFPKGDTLIVHQVLDSGVVLLQNIVDNSFILYYFKKFDKFTPLESVVTKLYKPKQAPLYNDRFYGDVEISTNGRYILLFIADSKDAAKASKWVRIDRLEISSSIEDLV